MAWTQFWDMHSGGGKKERWDRIYIEAPKDEAMVIFYNRFGHNPFRITCTCCGEDYSVSEEETFAEVSAFHRNCDYEGNKYVERQRRGIYTPDDMPESAKYKTTEEYKQDPDILVIPADEIEDDERTGHVPDQGYIWVD